MSSHIYKLFHETYLLMKIILQEKHLIDTYTDNVCRKVKELGGDSNYDKNKLDYYNLYHPNAIRVPNIGAQLIGISPSQINIGGACLGREHLLARVLGGIGYHGETSTLVAEKEGYLLTTKLDSDRTDIVYADKYGYVYVRSEDAYQVSIAERLISFLNCKTIDNNLEGKSNTTSQDTFLVLGSEDNYPYECTWVLQQDHSKYRRASCQILTTTSKRYPFPEFIELVEYVTSSFLGPETLVDFDFQRSEESCFSIIDLEKGGNKKLTSRVGYKLECILWMLYRIYKPRIKRFKGKCAGIIKYPCVLEEYRKKYGDLETCVAKILLN